MNRCCKDFEKEYYYKDDINYHFINYLKQIYLKFNINKVIFTGYYIILWNGFRLIFNNIYNAYYNYQISKEDKNTQIFKLLLFLIMNIIFNYKSIIINLSRLYYNFILPYKSIKIFILFTLTVKINLFIINNINNKLILFSYIGIIYYSLWYVYKFITFNKSY